MSGTPLEERPRGATTAGCAIGMRHGRCRQPIPPPIPVRKEFYIIGLAHKEQLALGWISLEGFCIGNIFSPFRYLPRFVAFRTEIHYCHHSSGTCSGANAHGCCSGRSAEQREARMASPSPSTSSFERRYFQTNNTFAHSLGCTCDGCVESTRHDTVALPTVSPAKALEKCEPHQSCPE